MSRNRDERIVSMEFDNAKFESGAKQTMSTLDKLNEKLKLKGAAEGSENVQKSVDRVDFSSMEKSIQNIERRFSTLGIVGMNVINKITNGIAGSVKQLEAATIGQIKSGGWNRAMNIANAKFQIEGLGFAWEEVEKAVSYGVKDTAYGLDAAASAASQLAASGVDFKKTIETVNGQGLTAMHKSLRAISGVAAMTNSSYEDISRIFTTVAGNGRLMGDQLLQLSSRGMNAAAKLAEVLGTTEEAVRDMVTKGQIDFQTFAFAMDDAFGQHAKEANKTFTGALSNMKAALSRVGEIFADPIVNKTNTLFISLTSRIDEFKNKLKSIKVPKTLEEIKKQYGDIALSATAYDEILKGTDDRTVTFGEHFAAMWESGINAFSKMIESVDISWFDKIVEKVDSVTVKLKEFFDLIAEVYGDSTEEAADGINDATKTLVVSAQEAQAAKDIVFKGMYGAGAARQKALKELFGGGEEGEKHAKNIQAYVDSVVAAGWDFEKASIKVAGANGELADSQSNIARTVKKERIKAVIDNITGGLKNLWTVAKNLGAAAKKIGKAILDAFTDVFKIDLNVVTDSAFSLTDALVKLSKKLIISDDTASKVTEVFKKFFEIVQKGIGYLKKAAEYAGNFSKSIGESKTFDALKKTFEDLFDKIGEFDALKISEDNPVVQALGNIFTAIDDLLTSNKDGPSKFTTFINDLIDSVTSVKWGELGKFAGLAIGVYSLFKVVYALKALGGLIWSISSLPANISSFFWKLGKSALDASWAYVIVSVAKSIAIVAGALVVLSQVPENDLYKAIGTLIIIALVIKFLMKTANTLGASQKSLMGIASAASSAFSVVKTMYGVATAILSLAGAVTIMSVGFGIIEKSGPSKESYAILMGILAGITLATAALINMIESIPTSAMLKITPVLAAMTLMFTGLGVAVLAISAGMALIGNIPNFQEAFGPLITMFIVIFAGIAALMQLVSNSNSVRLTAAAPAFLAIGTAITLIMSSIAGAFLMIALAFKMLPKFDEGIGKSIIALGAAFTVMMIGVISLVTLASSATNNIAGSAKLPLVLVSMAAVITAMGDAILLISAAMRIIGNVPDDIMGAALMTIATVFGGMILIMKISSEINPANMLSASLMFIAVSAAVVLMAGAIAVLSRLGSDQMITSAGAIFMVLVGIGIAMTIASTALKDTQNSAKLVIGGILAITVAIAVVAAALAKLSGTKNILESAIALIGIIVVIGAVFAIMASIGGENGNAADTMFAVGAAFIMVAGALLILAFAFEKLASIEGNITTAAIAFGVFAGVIVVLGAIGAIIGPAFTTAITAVGKAFLYAGIGAALVGAGIFLVCKGLQILAPAVGVMAISLEKFFTVLEEHKVTAIVVGVVMLALIVAITAAIIKFAPVLQGIADILSAVASRIGKTLDNGRKRLRGWTENLTVRGKAIIASMIITLCAAILKASPTVLNTVGQLLIKLLSFLGSIAGDLAMGLLDFVINLINGLADAIRANSARIAAAIWGVVISLVDVLLQILGQLLYMLISPISAGFAEEIQNAVTTQSKALNDYALAQRKMAEEADKEKRDYINSMREEAAAAEEASERNANAWGGITDVIKKESGEQKSELAELKEEYSDLPGYAYDAILRSKNPNLGFEKTGFNMGSDLMKGVTKGEDSVEIPAFDEYMTQNGQSVDAAGEYGNTMGTEYASQEAEAMLYPDEFYRSSDTNMQSSQQAIEDSEEETVKAIKAHYVDPATGTIEESRPMFYVAGKHNMEGLTQGFAENQWMYRDVVRKVSQDAVAEYKRVNGIESPSKVYSKCSSYIVAGIVQGIRRNADDVSKAVADMSDTALNAFNATPDYYYDSGKTIVDDFTSGIIQNGKSIDDAVSMLKDHIEITDSSMSRSYFNSGKHIVSRLSDGLAQNESDVSRVSNHVSDAMITPFRNLVDTLSDGTMLDVEIPTDKLYHNGEHLVDSFTNGIAQNADSVTVVSSALSDLVSVSIGGSSDFYYQNGSNIVSNFANGIAQNTDSAIGAANNLSDAVVNAFGNPIDYVGMISSGELQYDASVRPVFDNSGLYRGASSIGSMLNEQTISVTGLSGKLAADIGTLDRNNSDIVEELRALREDMSYMEDAMSQMQVVMDTGALVGSMAGPMDKAMGRRAIYRGRGN